MVRIGINGFGRIGRYLLRVMHLFPQCEVVVINGHRSSNEEMAYLLKYDSVHGRFPGKVQATENGLKIDDDEIAITRCGKGEWKWADYGVDIVVETSGTLKTREGLALHMGCGAKKVIISAPAKQPDMTVVMGVNHNDYDPAKHHILSNASCTTNCLAPIVKILNEKFGVKLGSMVTVHSYTNDQRILDLPHKDLRRARAAALNIIPTSTGAAKAVAEVIPAMKGRFGGYALRVPTPTVSAVDFTAILEKPTTTEELVAAFREAAEGELKGILAVNDLPLVSMDFKGEEHSSVVESEYCSVQEGTLAKVVAWYDNEWGYSVRVADLICHMQSKGL